MGKLKSLFRKSKQLGNQRGQGMAEYVLLIVVVLTIAFLFKDKIKGVMNDKLDQIGSGMGSFQVDK